MIFTLSTIGTISTKLLWKQIVIARNKAEMDGVVLVMKVGSNLLHINKLRKLTFSTLNCKGQKVLEKKVSVIFMVVKLSLNPKRRPVDRPQSPIGVGAVNGVQREQKRSWQRNYRRQGCDK